MWLNGSVIKHHIAPRVALIEDARNLLQAWGEIGKRSTEELCTRSGVGEENSYPRVRGGSRRGSGRGLVRCVSGNVVWWQSGEGTEWGRTEDGSPTRRPRQGRVDTPWEVAADGLAESGGARIQHPMGSPVGAFNHMASHLHRF